MIQIEYKKVVEDEDQIRCLRMIKERDIRIGTLKGVVYLLNDNLKVREKYKTQDSGKDTGMISAI